MKDDEIVDQSQLEKTKQLLKEWRKVGKYIGEMVNLILITSESPGKHYTIVLCHLKNLIKYYHMASQKKV